MSAAQPLIRMTREEVARFDAQAKVRRLRRQLRIWHEGLQYDLDHEEAGGLQAARATTMEAATLIYEMHKALGVLVREAEQDSIQSHVDDAMRAAEYIAKRDRP